jgi:tetratricopeptide (TPR) repeat protein
MRKRFRSVSAASLAMVVLVSLGAAGCGKYSFNSLKAKKNYREANELYTASKWGEAAENYEVAAGADPTLPGVFFFLGNSYDNMYKPSRAGEPENDAYIQKAIENYRIAAEKDPDPLFRERAMQYLVAAYGPEKLNNPAEAEPVVKKMIEMQPNEPTNYFALSKIYEDAGRYEEAEQALLRAKEVRPNDPVVYTTLSGFYNRQGDFDRTIEALHRAAELKPDDPTGYQLVATYYWEKAFKDHRLATAQKRDFILRGIEATDKAISLNPEYAEALTYKNILLRMQANTETDRAKQAALLKEADQIRNKAMELTKKKASGLS